MPDDLRKPGKRRRLTSFWPVLAPIYWLALVNAIICWSLTWLFWDRFEFSATLFALGCAPVAVAVCAYLFLLVRNYGKS